LRTGSTFLFGETHLRSRFFNIDLIDTLEADGRAARPHRQVVEPAI
jgi:hypothetical protein